VQKFRKCLPPWWDRDRDESSRPIRHDVREAAVSIWERVCAQIYRLLGDFAEAPELLEHAVQRVSLYLDKIEEPPTDPRGLLFVAVYRLARRRALRRERVQAIGGLNELSDLPGMSSPEDSVERRLFVDQILKALRPESRGILRLRLKGFSWDEIGSMMQVGAPTLQKRFWRDVRRAHLHLLKRPIAGSVGIEQRSDEKKRTRKPCY
jgi:DNA-directed RNA polymerase specialized sigma24 family protein